MSLQAPFLIRRFSVDDVGFFEGTEKLLEMWFDLSTLEEDSTRGLRDIPKLVKRKWHCLLEVVNATINHTVSSNSNILPLLGRRGRQYWTLFSAGF